VIWMPWRGRGLRDRSEDIPPLVEHFAQQVCAQNGWRPVAFTAEAVARLQSYAWPGNIRELRNMVERLLLLAGDLVSREVVDLALPATHAVEGVQTDDAAGPLADRVADFERKMILAELERNNRHITNTAKALGLERSYLYKKCQQLGIDLRKIHPTDIA
jgi:two-component system, NtrC family, nitrogen regulation response regulator NtrX